MITLAQKQQGFWALSQFVVMMAWVSQSPYWTDRKAIQNWGRQAEHVSVQGMGRQEFYQWYRIRVAEVFTDRAFMSE